MVVTTVVPVVGGSVAVVGGMVGVLAVDVGGGGGGVWRVVVRAVVVGVVVVVVVVGALVGCDCSWVAAVRVVVRPRVVAVGVEADESPRVAR